MIKTYYIVLIVVIIILSFVAYYVGNNEIKFKNFEKGEKIDSTQNLHNVIAEMNNKKRAKENKVNGVSAYLNPYELNTIQKRKDKNYLHGTTMFNIYNN